MSSQTIWVKIIGNGIEDIFRAVKLTKIGISIESFNGPTGMYTLEGDFSGLKKIETKNARFEQIPSNKSSNSDFQFEEPLSNIADIRTEEIGSDLA